MEAILAVMNTTELVVEIGPEKNLGLLQRYSFVNSDQIQRFTIISMKRYVYILIWKEHRIRGKFEKYNRS